jgi:hypothetical protein
MFWSLIKNYRYVIQYCSECWLSIDALNLFDKEEVGFDSPSTGIGKEGVPSHY